MLSEDQVLLINAIYIFLSRRYAITVFAKNAYKNDTKYFFILCKKQQLANRKRINQRNNEAEIIQQKKENQAIAQLVLIVISYLIGYIPITGKFESF